MDKNAIKTFAVDSRRKMIKSVKFQASLLGITADGIAEPISKAEGMETYDYGAGQHTIYDEDIKKRESLVREINNKGFENVVEEVAYTWFNRIIAIRYMEVNDYLPTYTRVLSSEIEGKIEPDIITEALDLDLYYSDEDREKIFKLKDESKLDELFQFLFIKQCNKLNDILPGLFEKTDDYMELLLDIKFTDENGIIRKLLDNIDEKDFQEQVEIMGWLYQFYISERKSVVIDTQKSKAIEKNDIPAATQLFTPDWIVKYMVDNSLGRYWIERKQNSFLYDKLNYYFDEPIQNDFVNSISEELRDKNINPESLKFFDPCMGSGHILIYAFDVFMDIYEECGYNFNEIPQLIIKNNLYGLDIDKRAYQLAYFTILMKARKYDRRILEKNITPHIFQIIDSNINLRTIQYIKNFDEQLGKDINYLNELFFNAEEFGSLIQVKNMDFEFIETKLEELSLKEKNTLVDFNIYNEILHIIHLLKIANILSSRYQVVVTNPPYLNKYDNAMKKFIKEHYQDYSKDLFSIFMYRNFKFCTDDGYVAFLTPRVWMFIKSHEKIREFLINHKSFVSLLELEYNAFWNIAHVSVCSFILSNQYFNSEYKGLFIKLSEFVGGLDVQNQKTLEATSGDVNYIYTVDNNKFKNIPGSPISYWVSDKFIETFDKGISIDEISRFTGSQNKTANNSKYLRYFWEVSNLNICEPNKWIFYAKGGDFRKYYGNLELIVDWSKEARYFYKTNKTSNLLDEEYWYKEGITYPLISSKGTSFRYLPKGCVFDMGGPTICYLEDNLYYILGLLNTDLIKFYLNILNPTINIQSKDIKALPIIIDENYKSEVNKIVLENITIFKEDYDSFETSFSFKIHPLLYYKENLMTVSYELLISNKEKDLNSYILNETRLNQIFLEIYGVNDIEYIIKEDDVELNLFKYEETIKTFISYAIGCMFGRYSLDEEGLQFAGGEFNINNYSKFIPDDDNIIPVLDTEYFNDDIVGRFVEFVKVCFGEETLEENLDFIAGALKKKGKTSREIIRNYFLTDFFKDHAQTYKKTPIYWQFDSGKQNAFKCLIYMHRYEPGLVARVRTDYLHKTQKAIEQNLAQCESIIANSSNKSEVSKATKDKSKYIKQLDEIKVYDEALAHIANQRIEIDLDDGVKVNHAKFQNVEISKEGQKAKKINLLKKI